MFHFPESMFHLLRIPCSTSSGVRNWHEVLPTGSPSATCHVLYMYTSIALLSSRIVVVRRSLDIDTLGWRSATPHDGGACGSTVCLFHEIRSPCSDFDEPPIALTHRVGDTSTLHKRWTPGGTEYEHAELCLEVASGVSPGEEWLRWTNAQPLRAAQGRTQKRSARPCLWYPQIYWTWTSPRSAEFPKHRCKPTQDTLRQILQCSRCTQ